jgi:hypothetical protein
MEYEEGLGGGGSHIAPKSKHNKVEKFFPVSVDNFFDNPDRIVKYAKSLPKEPDPIGKWPGKRTEALWKIDKELNDAIVLKIMSCYYDLSYQNVFWEHAVLLFQEIPTFSKNKNDVENRGWIHFDSNGGRELAGLIYLTPDIDPDSGTSLFEMKSHKEYTTVPHLQFAKHLMYKEDETIDPAYYAKRYKEEEECFIEKTRFANIYNRMIMYDAKEYHRANSFYIDDGKDARLTLVFFIGGLNVEKYPLERIKGGEYDEFIEHRTEIKQ